jgi:acetyltransferase-like isoleucine patch superfamily enzyme
VGDNNILVIGAFTSIGGATFFLKGENRIQIASCCMFSTGIIIDASDHHAIYDLKSGLKINPDSDVDISKKVWIGRNVSITKGTSIGSQSIIGQGSICSGALKCNSVYAGAPIRMIKENVTWSRMNANSISEMKNSDRHINWLKKYEEVKKIVGTSIDI